MAILWAVPPAVLLLGALLVLWVARQAGGLLLEVREELDQLSEVHLAVARVHRETAVTRHRLRRLQDS